MNTQHTHTNAICKNYATHDPVPTLTHAKPGRTRVRETETRDNARALDEHAHTHRHQLVLSVVCRHVGNCVGEGGWMSKRRKNRFRKRGSGSDTLET